jgi:hypothetical protein
MEKNQQHLHDTRKHQKPLIRITPTFKYWVAYVSILAFFLLMVLVILKAVLPGLVTDDFDSHIVPFLAFSLLAIASAVAVIALTRATVVYFFFDCHMEIRYIFCLKKQICPYYTMEVRIGNIGQHKAIAVRKEPFSKKTWIVMYKLTQVENLLQEKVQNFCEEDDLVAYCGNRKAYSGNRKTDDESRKKAIKKWCYIIVGISTLYSAFMLWYLLYQHGK